MKLLGTLLLNIIIFSSYIYIEQSVNGNYLPPGVSKIDHNGLYIDATEVTNLAWTEFVFSIGNKYGENSKEYKNVLPDSSIWYSVYSGDMFTIKGGFSEYPIVGITYSQAVEYCKFRSEKVNQSNPNYTTTYRLPTKEEWIIFSDKVQCESVQDKLYTYRKVKMFNGFCDNVSEMTNLTGEAIGRNWTDAKISEKKGVNNLYKYDSPQNNLGFRCVATFVKN